MGQERKRVQEGVEPGREEGEEAGIDGVKSRIGMKRGNQGLWTVSELNNSSVSEILKVVRLDWNLTGPREFQVLGKE